MSQLRGRISPPKNTETGALDCAKMFSNVACVASMAKYLRATTDKAIDTTTKLRFSRYADVLDLQKNIVRASHTE